VLWSQSTINELSTYQCKQIDECVDAFSENVVREAAKFSKLDIYVTLFASHDIYELHREEKRGYNGPRFARTGNRRTSGVRTKGALSRSITRNFITLPKKCAKSM
jgi:hypothetical protein